MNKILSIITPTFNCSKFLEQSINSVIAQQSKDEFEYIIIDGNSDDGTVDIIKKYESEIDYWISEPDRGQASALNKAIKISSGKYILWLNGDDYLCDGIVPCIIDSLKKLNEYETIYGDIISIDQFGNRYLTTYEPDRLNFEYLLNINSSILTNSTVYPKSIFYDTGFFLESLHYAFDYELYLRLVKNYRLIHLEKPVVTFRLHENSKTAKYPYKFDLEVLKISRSYGGRFFSANTSYRIYRLLSYLRKSILG